MSTRAETSQGQQATGTEGALSRHITRRGLGRRAARVLAGGYVAVRGGGDAFRGVEAVGARIGEALGTENHFGKLAREQLKPGKEVDSYRKLVVQPDKEPVIIRTAPAPGSQGTSDYEQFGTESGVAGKVEPGDVLVVANIAVVTGQETSAGSGNRWAVVRHNGKNGYIALTKDTERAVSLGGQPTPSKVKIVGHSEDGHDLIGETQDGTPVVLSVRYPKQKVK